MKLLTFIVSPSFFRAAEATAWLCARATLVSAWCVVSELLLLVSRTETVAAYEGGNFTYSAAPRASAISALTMHTQALRFSDAMMKARLTKAAPRSTVG